MKKSIDRHLNLFWNYSGSATKEDNVTRALINTLDLLGKKGKINFLCSILSKYKSRDIKKFLVNFENERLENIEVSFDLQNPYLKIKEMNIIKILIGLNPSGKTWDEEFEGVLRKIEIEKIHKEKELKEYLEQEIGDYIKEKELNIKDILKKIKILKNKGESRVDGWIFIHIKEKLEVAIAIETKLWDLDPYQLENHRNKSLEIKGISENKIFKFEEVCENLKSQKLENKVTSKIVKNYLEYMELNGWYINNDSFKELDILGIKNIKEWEEKEKEEKDVIILKNEALKRRWLKYFDEYFKSKEWRKLSEEEILRDKTHQWINIKNQPENLYFDIDESPKNNNAFFISLEIGTKSNKRAKEIKKKLDKEKIKDINREIIKDIRVESYYQIFKRLNSNSYSTYFQVKENENLEVILNLYKNDENLYLNKLSKGMCLEEIEKLDKSFNIDWVKNKIKASVRGEVKEDGEIKSYYNLLSYLRFVDTVDYKNIIGRSKEEIFDLFSKIIIKQLKIAKILNN